jgi:hypothetical protein
VSDELPDIIVRHPNPEDLEVGEENTLTLKGEDAILAEASGQICVDLSSAGYESPSLLRIPSLPSCRGRTIIFEDRGRTIYRARCVSYFHLFDRKATRIAGRHSEKMYIVEISWDPASLEKIIS